MRPEKLTSNNVIQMAKDQDQFMTLDVKVEEEDGILIRTSYWRPNEIEIRRLQKGGAIAVTFIGNAFPPMLVNTERPASWRQ